MARPCSICASSEKARKAAEMIAASATDQAIAEQLGVGRMAVSRHRQNHIVAPAKALVEAASKGQDVAEQRAQMMAAAQAGDPSAFVALAAIVNDLRQVHDRLERTANAAEQDGQRMAVAGLSAQQLRAAEVRAKIGGLGSYAPGRGTEGSQPSQFSVNIIFGNGTVERITTASGESVQRPTIDANTEDEETAPMPGG